jgi:hypothetical protein
MQRDNYSISALGRRFREKGLAEDSGRLNWDSGIYSIVLEQHDDTFGNFV